MRPLAPRRYVEAKLGSSAERYAEMIARGREPVAAPTGSATRSAWPARVELGAGETPALPVKLDPGPQPGRGEAMARPNETPTAVQEEIVRRYQAGETNAQIKAATRMGSGVIYATLRRRGVPLRGRPTPAGAGGHAERVALPVLGAEVRSKLAAASTGDLRALAAEVKRLLRVRATAAKRLPRLQARIATEQAKLAQLLKEKAELVGGEQ